MDKPISIEVTVSGRVQGVFYRAATQEKARELGIRGWVRNEPDGSVHALLQHESQDVLERMLNWMKHGPDRAAVNGVEPRPVTDAKLYDGFEILG